MKSLLALCLLLVACGGKTENTLSDAGTDGEGFDAKPLVPGCPSAEPQAGSSCTKEGLECEYGNDPRWSCNAVARCESGSWAIALTDTMWCPTPATNPPECPATFGGGGTCTATGTPCHYAQGWCACLDLGGPPMPDASTMPTWQCSTGTTSQGCPATRPRIGTACTQPDTWCDYGMCGQPDGLAVQCDGTTLTWAESFGAPCGGAN